jgi:hypothetical protein
MRASRRLLAYLRISETLAANTLGALIGALLAAAIGIVYPYRYTLLEFWRECLRCITGDLH